MSRGTPTLAPGFLAPPSGSTRAEVLLGRTLAACCYPVAAWHTHLRSFRALLLTGYFVAGYVSVLAALVALD